MQQGQIIQGGVGRRRNHPLPLQRRYWALRWSSSVVVSIFQATTQINEQTLAFVPKIIGIFIALLIFGGWMLTTLSDFTTRIFGYATTMIG